MSQLQASVPDLISPLPRPTAAAGDKPTRPLIDVRRLSDRIIDILARPRVRTLSAVAAGLVAAAASLGLRYVLRGPLGDGEHLVALFPCLLAASLVWGELAGLLCLVVGLAGAWYVFMGTPFSFILAPHEGAGLLAAMVAGAATIALAGLLRRLVARLRFATAHQTLLARELEHRVKNNLLLASSISRRTYVPWRDLRDSQREFEERLNALAMAHAAISRSPSGDLELADILERSLRPFGFGRGGGAFEVAGPNLILQPRAAVAFTLAIHELATNAAKYGALSTPEGRISVHWSLRHEGRPTLHFTWTERGGPLVTAPASRGFGSQLIERNLAAELDGEAVLDFAPEGLTARIRAAGPFTSTHACAKAMLSPDRAAAA